jgi:hypothetical protein
MLKTYQAGRLFAAALGIAAMAFLLGPCVSAVGAAPAPRTMPEPSSLPLLAMGLLGLAGFARRKFSAGPRA